MSQSKSLDGTAVSVLLILCLSWGVQQVVVKLTAPDISLVMQAGLRSAAASMAVAVWCWIRGVKIFDRDGTLLWGIGAGVLFGFEFLMIYWGLAYTNASRAVIFVYLAPFVVALGSRWFVPGEALGRLQLIGMAVAFAGILVAFGESFSLPSKQMLLGDVMLVVAAICWGATTVLIKASPLIKINAARTLLYQLAVSAVVLIPCSLLLGEPGVVRWSELAIASMLFQTLWIACVTYAAWFWLIQKYSAPKLSSFTFITPLFGVLAGWWVLDEPVTTQLVFAAALVAVGIFLVNKPDHPAETETARV